LLLKAVTEACARQGAAALASGALINPAEDAPSIKVPGYSIVKEIATSNFSSVFLARSERLRRNVVLKVMSRGTTEREIDDGERFQREYEIISSISTAPSRKSMTSARSRITSTSPWSTSPAATCATGCVIP
jgi:serine/threonine protein kinase